MGRPLIYYTIESLKKMGIKQIIIIQSPDRDIEKELKNYKFSGVEIKYVVQKKPLGMGNALWQVKNLLKDNFLVLNAGRMDINEIVQGSKFRTKRTILFGQKTNTPELFGIAKMTGNKILRIVEKPKKGKEPSNIKIIGVYLLEPKFFDTYNKIKKHHTTL